MKISKRQLRQIIKEEKTRLLEQQETHADRAIGLYFDVNQQKMAFDSLSVLFDESVEDAMLDGMEDVEAVDAVSAGLRQVFEEWLASRGM
jgi:predicted transcriptional regulator YheO